MGWLDEEITAQFSRWDERARGWRVWPYPVELEPPFVRFPGYTRNPGQFVDDGRRPNALISGLTKLGLLRKPAPPELPPEPEPESEPNVLERAEVVELQLSLPARFAGSPQDIAPLFTQLGLCREPIAFEILAAGERITLQFAAHPADAPIVRRQITAHFPDVVVIEQKRTLASAWEATAGSDTLVVEFALAQEFALPLARLQADPYIGLMAALGELNPGELGLFQVLFQPVEQPWAESLWRAVSDDTGKSFFQNAPDLPKLTQEKLASPLFAAVVRLAIRAPDFERSLEIARDLAGALRLYARFEGNELIPLQNVDYPDAEHFADVILRQCRRSGMLLNTEELTGFVHLPTADVRTPRFRRAIAKTKAAPAVVSQTQGVILGENQHAGKAISVRLTPEQRVRHTHIVGASGKGKSNLLLNLIRQDIENGEGVAVLDPHGDLVDKILTIIPPGRIGEVVLMDPSDEEFSVGFNILSAHSDLEKTLLASDLVAVFRRLSTSWGDQMNSVLQNAILAFLESDRRGTIADLRRFLIEPPFRNEFLKSVQDSEVVYYWQKSFPLLAGNKSIGSILTRLDTFLTKKPIRRMVSQPENRIDFAHIMDHGQIFLAKLSKGMLGEENSQLLGTFLVAKFQQSAMSRQAQEAELRKDFWLYIDEFQDFITPSLAQMLTGARKYRVGLTLAHQELRHLERDADVASAVLSNTGTRICFGVGDDDARKLAEGFSFFDARDLQSLEVGQAICRVDKASQDFNLAVPPFAAVDPQQAGPICAAVIATSRKKYARPRAEIEAASWAKLGVEPSLPREPGGQPPPTPVPKPTEPKPPKVPPPAERALPEAAPLTETEPKDGQHTAIKNAIGAEAESLDYTVSFEELFPELQGRADIVLRRGSQTIICQVTVTTQVEYEVESLRKFLPANFSQVAVISSNRKKLGQIQQQLTEAGSPSAKVGFYSPEEFITKLYGWATDDPEGGDLERGKLRKKKIALDAGPISEAERQAKEKQMLKEIREAMKRKPES